MRKSYFILAAVATILASCAENGKITNDLRSDENKAVIGFSNYAVKPTKAGTDLEDFHQTFVVYSTKVIEGETTVQNVFGDAPTASALAVEGTVCTYDADATNFYGSNWKYTGLRFWDTRAKYDFIAYAPSAAPLKFQYKNAEAKVQDADNKFVTTANVTLYGQNLQDGAQGTDAEKNSGFTESDEDNKKDADIMISNLVKDQDGRTYVATSPKKHVDLEFHHILSKLNVRIAKDQFLDNAKVEIKSVTLEGLKYAGEYGNTTKNKWTASERAANSNYTLSFNYDEAAANKMINENYITVLPESENNTLKYKYFVESLVMPQTLPTTCDLTIKYDITVNEGTADEHTESYISVKDISDTNIFTDFVDRYNYTLSIIIRPEVITFDATAAAWDYNEGKTYYTTE